jgi:hypothetical protein
MPLVIRDPNLVFDSPARNGHEDRAATCRLLRERMPGDEKFDAHIRGGLPPTVGRHPDRISLHHQAEGE